MYMHTTVGQLTKWVIGDRCLSVEWESFPLSPQPKTGFPCVALDVLELSL